MMNSNGYPRESRHYGIRRDILRDRERPTKFDMRNLVRIPGNSINRKDGNLILWQTETRPTA